MQDYNQNRNGRSLRKYCKDEAVDYNWLMEFKKTYSATKPLNQSQQSFISLSLEEEVPEGSEHADISRMIEDVQTTPNPS